MDNQQFRGIIPPMVTPLKGWDTLDPGWNGAPDRPYFVWRRSRTFSIGDNGGSAQLESPFEKRDCPKGIGPDKEEYQFVGITDTSFDESINLAEYAAEKGASAVVLAPPYYFPAGQLELLEYLEHLVPRLPLPLFLYNMPTHTKLFFEPETVKAASEIPGVIGLKDSSANMVYFHQLQQIFKDHNDFRLFIGPEELLGETLVLGGHGGVVRRWKPHPRIICRIV